MRSGGATAVTIIIIIVAAGAAVARRWAASRPAPSSAAHSPRNGPITDTVRARSITKPRPATAATRRATACSGSSRTTRPRARISATTATGPPARNHDQTPRENNKPPIRAAFSVMAGRSGRRRAADIRGEILEEIVCGFLGRAIDQALAELGELAADLRLDIVGQQG